MSSTKQSAAPITRVKDVVVWSHEMLIKYMTVNEKVKRKCKISSKRATNINKSVTLNNHKHFCHATPSN